MKFFIPRIGPDNAEVFYSGMRSFLADEWGFALTPRRIQRITYTAKGERHDVAVGKQLPGGFETAYAILETPEAYLICTPQHGIAGQPPVQVKRKDTVEIADFDPVESAQAV